VPLSAREQQLLAELGCDHIPLSDATAETSPAARDPPRYALNLGDRSDPAAAFTTRPVARGGGQLNFRRPAYQPERGRAGLVK
jgi:hypothetical protein